jgi:hypothetical protein
MKMGNGRRLKLTKRTVVLEKLFWFILGIFVGYVLFMINSMSTRKKPLVDTKGIIMTPSEQHIVDLALVKDFSKNNKVLSSQLLKKNLKDILSELAFDPKTDFHLCLPHTSGQRTHENEESPKNVIATLIFKKTYPKEGETKLLAVYLRDETSVLESEVDHLLLNLQDYHAKGLEYMDLHGKVYELIGDVPIQISSSHGHGVLDPPLKIAPLAPERLVPGIK